MPLASPNVPITRFLFILIFLPRMTRITRIGKKTRKCCGGISETILSFSLIRAHPRHPWFNQFSFPYRGDQTTSLQDSVVRVIFGIFGRVHWVVCVVWFGFSFEVLKD